MYSRSGIFGKDKMPEQSRDSANSGNSQGIQSERNGNVSTKSLPVPRIAVSPSSPGQNGNPTYWNPDHEYADDTDGRSPHNIPCCSYRVSTSDKHESYEHLDELRYRALYMGLVDNTTAHGLPQIHRARGCMKKSFWVILTLGLISVWIWNSIWIISSFIKFDVTLSYDLTLASRIDFPAVTICNQNIAKSSMLGRHDDATDILVRPSSQLPGRIDYSDDDDKVLGIISSSSRLPPPPPPKGRHRRDSNNTPKNIRLPGKMPPPVKSDASQRKALIEEYISDMEEEDRIELGHELDTLIPDALFAGFEMQNGTFTHFYDSTYGNCYTFNSGANGIDNTLQAYNSGPDYGLSSIFDIEQDEYIGEITSKAGIRIVIHPQASPAFPSENGIDVPPGAATSFGIKKVIVRRLGGWYGNCVNTSLSHANINVYEELYNWTKYTIIGCKNTCYQKQVMKRCGCFDQNYPDFGTAFQGLNYSGVCQSGSKRQTKCKNRIYDKFGSGDLKCGKCMKPCTEEFFELTISSSTWPADKHRITLAQYLAEHTHEHAHALQMIARGKERSNLGLLDVYFASLNLEEMNEQPAYDPSQFIADIGGAIGLWMGASILTLFEFGEFIFDAFILTCAKCCRCNRRRDKNTAKSDRRQKSPKRSPYSASPKNQTNLGVDPVTNWPSLERRAKKRSEDWVRREDSTYRGELGNKLNANSLQS